MLTHVLRTPIAVYMSHATGVKNIGTYGEEYTGQAAEAAEAACGAAWPVRVLFHGAGHYEALLPSPVQLQSRL
jgi:OTU domain-containing protein 6